MTTIRPATPTDLDALHAHNLAMALESEGRHLDSDTLRAGLNAVLHDPTKGFYIVAEHEGRVVGNLMITTEWSDWRNAPMWWFQSVYVAPSARKLGVFSAMYRHIRQMAKEAGARELRLYVERDNTRAQAAYEKMGMQLSHYDMWEEAL